MKKPSILVVGSMNMDLNIYGISRIPDYGESVPGSNYVYTTGGKGANQAYAAALHGANVNMVGRVGDDRNGHAIVTELKHVGIDTRFVVMDQETQTGMAPIMVDDSGNYFSCVVLGANNRLHPEDVEAALNSKDFDMVLMQLEMPLETVYRTYELADEKGIPVFLDAGPAMNIPLERLKGLYILSPNESETKALTGITIDSEENVLEAAKMLFHRAEPNYVILKMGERGSFVYDGIQGKMYPAFDVVAKDSTAAGDTFNASLAIKLCVGYDMDEAIKYASAAAGLCVSRYGAQVSIPTPEEVQAFMNEFA